MKDASRPSRLLDRWVEALPSKGRYSFTAREASDALLIWQVSFVIGGIVDLGVPEIGDHAFG